MKKTLFTLVAATAMILGLTGCDALTGKFDADALDNDSKDWASESKVTKKESEMMKVILADTDAIQADTSWWIWTDEKGIVLPTQPTGKKGDKGYEFTFTESIIGEVDYNNAPGSERFVLYITLKGDNKTVKTPDTGKKEGKLEDYDVRGRVCVYKDRIVNVKIEKYPELISKVGVVTIKNDEPEANSVFKDGDYSINAIYPLDPKADEADTETELVNKKIGGTYVVEGTMCFEGLDIKKEKTVSFPVKAGNQVIGLYQAHRGDNFKKITDESYTGPKTKAEITDKNYFTDSDGTKMSRADLLELDIKDDDTDEDAVKKYVKANGKIIFAKEISIEAHKKTETALGSSGFGSPWFVKKLNKITRVKAIGDEVELSAINAPIEK